MNYQTKVNALAQKWGAEIGKVRTEDGWQVEVEAPVGQCWDAGLYVLTARFGGTWGPASEAWQDLHTRMREGLQDDAEQ